MNTFTACIHMNTHVSLLFFLLEHFKIFSNITNVSDLHHSSTTYVGINETAGNSTTGSGFKGLQ